MSPDLERARALILAFGTGTTCYQILNPGFTLWFSEAGDAVVGYVPYRNVRVVGGEPVCPGHRLADVAAEFERDAGREGTRVCYFGAETRLRRIYRPVPAGYPSPPSRDAARHAILPIGGQPVWDPRRWPEMLHGHASLRAQVNRAKNKGVTVAEWTPEQARDNPALRQCLNAWLETRGLPPLHFLIETDTLARPLDRRFFVAACRGQVIAFLVAAPIPGRRGWLVEQIVRGHAAVNGTSELLVDACTRAVAQAGSRCLTLGLAPLARRPGTTEHLPPLWLRSVLGWMRAHANRFYNFRGLEAFKAKFRPSTWEPVFAIANAPAISPAMLYAVAGAFAGGPPGRLLARSLTRALQHETARAYRHVRHLIP
ncbi:MAG: hypothetical protein KatS3mg044_1074 [Rhodothermaceae bacterium]|nr:MAG: hypothetical protein KatS3mg044_1074 [Rhodothermaceae bacterium]